MPLAIWTGSKKGDVILNDIDRKLCKWRIIVMHPVNLITFDGDGGMALNCSDNELHAFF